MRAPRNVPTVIQIGGREFIIWEDIDNKFIRACLAEFLAMHLFVLLCCGRILRNKLNSCVLFIRAPFLKKSRKCDGYAQSPKS